jgi:hypothetical protein
VARHDIPEPQRAAAATEPDEDKVLEALYGRPGPDGVYRRDLSTPADTSEEVN